MKFLKESHARRKDFSATRSTGSIPGSPATPAPLGPAEASTSLATPAWRKPSKPGLTKDNGSSMGSDAVRVLHRPGSGVFGPAVPGSYQQERMFQGGGMGKAGVGVVPGGGPFGAIRGGGDGAKTGEASGPVEGYGCGAGSREEVEALLVDGEKEEVR